MLLPDSSACWGIAVSVRERALMTDISLVESNDQAEEIVELPAENMSVML